MYTRTFQQVVLARLLTSKRLFIDTSWSVLVYIYIYINRLTVNSIQMWCSGTACVSLRVPVTQDVIATIQSDKPTRFQDSTHLSTVLD